MKKKFITMLICGYMTAFFICNSQTQTIEANAEGVIIDTGNRDVDKFVYNLTEWIDENKNIVVESIQDLEDKGIAQKIDLLASTSLFAYFLTDYYDTHAVGAGLIEPTGSAISGIYQIENDSKLYSASAYTIDSKNGGLIANSLHYSMGVRFEAVNYDPNNSYTTDDLIQNLEPISDYFNVGGKFNVAGISNTGLRIYYNGSGLFNSSTYLTGAVTGYRITAYLNPNKSSIPTITNGYNWGNNPIMCTGYGNGFFSLPTGSTNDSTPWDYYNNNLLPQIIESYPDLLPTDFPFNGEPYNPAVIDPTEPDPTEPPTIERTTLPNWVQPVTEIIEITDESDEIIETELQQITDTNGNPQYNIEMPTIPKLNIPDINIPSAEIPNGFTDTISAIWTTIYRILNESGIMQIIPFVLICGIIVFAIKFLGG